MHDASGRASDPSCIDHRADSTQSPDSQYESHMIQHRHSIRSPRGLRPLSFHLLPLVLLLCLALFVAACSSHGGAVTGAERDAALRQVATAYEQNGDLGQAQAALDKLNLANPGQLLLSLAEADVISGRSPQEVAVTAKLAEALGAHSQKVTAYLAPSPVPQPVAQASEPTVEPAVLAATVEIPTAVPASPTPAPTAEPTATPAPPTPTSVPPTNSPTPEPQNPRVVADSEVNLRGGPGTGYPVVGRLGKGKETAIIGRNASGDWWQVDAPGVKQAWVAGTVVRVLGAIDTVAVAKNIPPAPTAAPKPTAAPQPTAIPVAAGPDFKLTVHRLWTVEETGGFLNGTSVNCGYQHNLHVYVKDAAGNLLNGVTIREVGGVQQELVSGSKAPGMAEFDLYPPGKDVIVVRDVDGRAVTSDTGAAPSVPVAISYDNLRSGHYCTDDADCAHFVGRPGCYGHFSWDIVFTRNY